jgi:uncharacterized surface protein with fasciclin (FAS1) repeats
MIRHRTLAEVRRFTWFKIIVLIILLLLLLYRILFWVCCPDNGVAGSLETPTISPTLTLTVVSPTEEPPAEPTIPAPTAPTLSLPEGTLRTGTISLTGQADAGSMVAVVIDGEQVGTAVAGENGQWAFDAQFPEPGSYEIRVQAVDENGRSLAESSPITATIKQTLAAPTLDLPERGSLITGEPITLTGTGTPGSTVEIVVNGEVIGTAVTGEDGSWTFDYTPAAAGTATLQVRAADDDGTTAAEGETITIDIAQPAEDALTVLDKAGSFSTLLAALETAGLTETIQETDPLTFFAPTDEAFARLPEGMTDALLANPEALQQLLAYHMVGDAVTGTAVLQSSALESIAGLPIPVSRSQNGDPLVQYSAITRHDVQTRQGFVHVIDRVMIPPQVEPPVIDETGVPIFKGPLLTVVGTAEPGTTLLLEIDDEWFGETAVADDGTWLIADNIDAGEHIIIAYTLAEDGTPLAVSKPVVLVSP